MRPPLSFPPGPHGIAPSNPMLPLANRTGSQPGAFNPNELRTKWQGNPSPITWVDPAVLAVAAPWAGPVGSGIVGRAIWEGPTFNLRSDLGGSAGIDPDRAVPINHGAMFGAGTRLFLLIEGVAASTVDVEAYWMERAHPYNPTAVQIVANRRDCTPDLWDVNPDTGAVMLWATPPGDNVWFWQPILVFDQVEGALGDAPSFQITAGVM